MGLTFLDPRDVAFPHDPYMGRWWKLRSPISDFRPARNIEAIRPKADWAPRTQLAGNGPMDLISQKAPNVPAMVANATIRFPGGDLADQYRSPLSPIPARFWRPSRFSPWKVAAPHGPQSRWALSHSRSDLRKRIMGRCLVSIQTSRRKPHRSDLRLSISVAGDRN